MMTKKLDNDFLLLYTKALENYLKCIDNKENDFLIDEIDIPLADIKVVENEIRFIYSQRNFQKYIVEVKLLLFKESNEIGKYLYIEDDEGTIVDDFLVFY